MRESNKEVQSTSNSMIGPGDRWGRGGVALALATTLILPFACSKDTDVFSAEEWERVKLIAPFSAEMPRNIANDRSDEALIKFAQKLFFDKDMAEGITVAGPTGALNDVGKVSCFTCHGGTYLADARAFPQSHGRSWLAHNTPAMINLGYMTWTFWTGRFDSQAEHGAAALGGAASTLAQAHYLYKKHRDEYNALFPMTPLPPALDPTAMDAARFPATGNQKGTAAAADGAFDKMARADQWEIHKMRGNLSRVWDAYGRALNTPNSPFERYVGGMRDDKVFNGRARNGLKLFIGKASCIDCHNGPALTDNQFHNVGVQDLTALPTGSTTAVNLDRGRAGVMLAAFNNAIFLNRTNRLMEQKPEFAKTDQLPVFSGAGQFSDHGDEGLQRLIDEDNKYCIQRRDPVTDTSGNATTCGLFFKAPNPNATPPDAGDPRFAVCMEANEPYEACTKYHASLEGVFRTPSLISVAMTGPYFHTGETKSLRDVVEHYNKGGGAEGSFVGVKSPRLRPLLLTESEMDDLVEFLRSLTGDAPSKELTCNPLVAPEFDAVRGCGPMGAGAPTGGATGTAGTSGMGGGAGRAGTGGMTGMGGMTGAGGMTGSGGAPGSGGMASSGGAPASGGASGTGGAAGGSAGSGG
jgi:cytochrome c peroxidase